MGAPADDSCGAGIEKFAFQASRIGPAQLWNFLLAVKYLVGSWEKDWASSRIQADAPGSSIDHLDNWTILLAHAPCDINFKCRFAANPRRNCLSGADRLPAQGLVVVAIGEKFSSQYRKAYETR
jgi:hypothetical protein